MRGREVLRLVPPPQGDGVLRTGKVFLDYHGAVDPCAGAGQFLFVLADGLFVDTGGAIFIRRLHDAGKHARARHGYPGGGEHGARPVLSAAEGQGGAARSGKGDLKPFQQRGDVGLEIGPAQGRFAGVEDHVGLVRVEHLQHFAKFAAHARHGRLGQGRPESVYGAAQIKLIGHPPRFRALRRQRMKNQQLHAIVTPCLRAASRKMPWTSES